MASETTVEVIGYIDFIFDIQSYQIYSASLTRSFINERRNKTVKPESVYDVSCQQLSKSAVTDDTFTKYMSCLAIDDLDISDTDSFYTAISENEDYYCETEDEEKELMRNIGLPTSFTKPKDKSKKIQRANKRKLPTNDDSNALQSNSTSNDTFNTPSSFFELNDIRINDSTASCSQSFVESNGLNATNPEIQIIEADNNNQATEEEKDSMMSIINAFQNLWHIHGNYILNRDWLIAYRKHVSKSAKAQILEQCQIHEKDYGPIPTCFEPADQKEYYFAGKSPDNATSEALDEQWKHYCESTYALFFNYFVNNSFDKRLEVEMNLNEEGFSLALTDKERPEVIFLAFNCVDNYWSRRMAYSLRRLVETEDSLSDIKDLSSANSFTVGADSEELKPSAEITFDFDPERDEHLVAMNVKPGNRLHQYWRKRYDLFSLFDQGILLDYESWFSVTPEAIAKHNAERFKNCRLMVDAFCGSGGNTIQFAKKCYVVAIDLDPVKIKCAKRNAEIYGVSHKIEFICGDFLAIARSIVDQHRPIDAVYLAPPWGGPSYAKKKVFNIATDCTPDGEIVFEAAEQLSENIAYYLPKNTCTMKLAMLAGPGKRVEIEQNILNKKFKSITAYYGNLRRS